MAPVGRGSEPAQENMVIKRYRIDQPTHAKAMLRAAAEGRNLTTLIRWAHGGEI